MAIRLNAKERRRLSRLAVNPPPPPPVTNPTTGEHLTKTERRRISKLIKKNKARVAKGLSPKPLPGGGAEEEGESRPRADAPTSRTRPNDPALRAELDRCPSIEKLLSLVTTR